MVKNPCSQTDRNRYDCSGEKTPPKRSFKMYRIRYRNLVGRVFVQVERHVPDDNYEKEPVYTLEQAIEKCKHLLESSPQICAVEIIKST